MNTPLADAGFGDLGGNGSGWTVRTHTGGTVVPTVDGATLRLDISHIAGVNRHGELCCAPFPVAAGGWLEVSFGARLMTSGWRTYTHRWQPTVSEPAARLNFAPGQIDNRVELEETRLTAAA